MKKAAGLFLVALLAGAVTLGAYKLFFDQPTYRFIGTDDQSSFVPTRAGVANNSGADFTIAAQKTVHAVVHVKNVTAGNSGSGGLLDFWYGNQARQRPQVGTGSGVIISPDGYIVTNNHVIDKSVQLQVTLNNNKIYEAEIIGADPNTDIALLKIDAEEDLPYLAFGNSDQAQIGEWVLAVGNPFNLTSTVTAGIISAKARSLSRVRNQSFIQTDAAVNPGNSGGALVNTNGDLIGINTAITSQTGSYVGYSFAVPSNIAKKVVEDLMEFGNVQKGLLGISAPRLNTTRAIELGLNEIEGVYVSTVEEESGADEAGLQEGDIIKGVDEIQVRKFEELTGYLASKRPGDQIEVSLEREGKVLNLPVTLKKASYVDINSLGLRVKNLTQSDRKTFGVSKGVKVVAIARNQRESFLNKVIVEVNDEPIRNIEDANRIMSGLSQYELRSITFINKDGDRERLIQ
ncbi:trypsin-like peptidase domain-containing protein [Aureicoccus marinus]|jgi:Do/DeqQ family serine protease|uniref:Serine protease n=1 Tax=Aureicoccus marinus TaxID=754435 RepID=A0A2S7T5W5_9FLAO|nr:trypsin-like peptidase domain-containing protein [Aureicoccus marinus]PQJ14846.1 serine protease [Aureicoccus marinus]